MGPSSSDTRISAPISPKSRGWKMSHAHPTTSSTRALKKTDRMLQYALFRNWLLYEINSTLALKGHNQYDKNDFVGSTHMWHVCVNTFSAPQPSPARNANTRVQRPPEPGNPATPLPNTAKTDRPRTKKDRFITMCFWKKKTSQLLNIEHWILNRWKCSIYSMSFYFCCTLHISVVLPQEL